MQPAASGHSGGPEEPTSSDGAGEHKTASRKKRRRRIAAWSLTAVAVLVIAAVTVVGVYLYQLRSAFDEQRNVLDLQMEDETAYRTSDDVINVLLLGSDSRGEEEDQYRDQIGDSDGERSDTMMLVHIPEDRSGVYVMSIVRDLWVDVPGEGEGRINSAFGLGDEDLVVSTIEELLNTHIDHVAMIDFDGFSDLTTALGGVYVDNPRAFSAGQHNPSFYPEGTIRLEGANALRFVRERKAFPTGDYVRVENQQLVVQAIVDRFLSTDTLTNPQRVMDVVNGIVPFLSMDEGLDADTVAGYALEMADMRSEDIHMFTIPTGEHATTAAGAQVILQDEEMMELLERSMRNENMDGFLEYLDMREGDPEGESGQGEPEESAEEDEAPEDAESPEQLEDEETYTGEVIVE